VTVAQVIPAAANLPTNPAFTCSSPADGSSFTCTVGTLLIGQSVKFRLILNVPAANGSYSVWLMASLNERSSNGKNQDSFFSTGTIGVAAPTCAVNQNYFLSTEAISLSTPTGCTQPTTVSGDPAANGSLVSVGIDPPNTCPIAVPTPCQGDTSVANVDSGQTGPVTWTITFNFVPTYVIHFHSNYNPSDASTYDVILLSDPPCASASATNCWISVTPGPLGPAPVTVEFRTPNNQSARGG
jgi:hypothetical protein